MKKFNVNTIARLGISLALIIVVELLESSFLNMPQGGSISLSSLVFLLSMMMFSFAESAILFVLWRVLIMFIVPPYIVTPLQFFLDYIAAYLVFLLVYPLVKKETIAPVIIAITIANVCRYVIHVITGMVYFAEYAEDTPLLQYSLFYNLTYMGPTLVAQIILAVLAIPTFGKWAKKIEA